MADRALFCIPINNVIVSYPSYDDILKIINDAIQHATNPQSICYVNAQSIVLNNKNKEFSSALRKFSFLYADGFGIHLTAAVLDYWPEGLKKNHNATDFNHVLLKYADKNHLKLFFVGTHQRSLDNLRIKLRELFPDIFIAGLCDGYDGLHDPSLIERINNAGADILVVGMGSPKQEIWIQKHRESIHTPVCITVGAFLDFVSGKILRAPKIIRFLRLEWLFRLLQEPGRLWRRYIIGIPIFIYIILRQKLFDHH